MSVNAHQPGLARPSSEGGFAMIITIGVMFVTSLLLVAAFMGANGDIHLSNTDLTQKQAHFAALAGVQEYENQLQANPNYWQTCKAPNGKLNEGKYVASYEITLLNASTAPKTSKGCETANPFTSMIESKGTLANTFRIESTGHVGTEKRSVVATFQVTGFLNYIYFTQYEVADPESYESGDPRCGEYRAARQAAKLSCQEIVFGPEDKVNGPLHTDDTAIVCGGAEFGRAGHEPPDVAEMNGGVASGCEGGSGKYNTPTKSWITGPELVAPESDGSLRLYVEHPAPPQENEFKGLTHLVLEGTKIKVTTIEGGVNVVKTIEWPENGLLYVQRAAPCTYEYRQTSADTAKTLTEEESCGTVYVSGNYSKSLTIGAQDDLVINGNITQTGVAAGSPPTGTTTLGLIATRFVRMYHPCSGGTNGAGSLTNPYVYGAILSTSHSFLVDNYNCGATMGKLNIYGAIAQKFRGIVGEVGTHGYDKEYSYDERLATDEPPYFLAPLKAGWRIARETAPTRG